MSVSRRGASGPLPRVVAGRYELGRVLGEGDVGSVYSARDCVTGAEVAVKFLDATSAQVTARVHREISALRLLRLPGVVTLLDDGIEGPYRFLVMDLVPGVPFPGAEGPVPWETLAPVALGLLEALARVHAAGVVHRDLKPANVLVDPALGVTVLDFGISWGPALGSAVTTEGVAVGTPDYMAPEQFVGSAADARADLYAVGVMLYRSLTGRPPHAGIDFAEFLSARRGRMPTPLRLMAPSVPRDVAQVVDQLLSMDPEDRPQSAGEAIEALFGMRPRGFSHRSLPRLGGDGAVRRVVEAALARRALDVAGPAGSGRSRVLTEAAERLVEGGRTVVWLVPSSAPYSSLAGIVGGTEELNDSSHQDALAVLRRRVEAALHAGTILFADDAGRLDRWSASLLEECRAAGSLVRVTKTPAADALVIAELTEADLRPLFRGPDRIFHLREDGACELWRRTGGLPSRVSTELAAWVRAGFAHWDGAEIVIGRDALDRLRSGQPVGDELLLHPGVASAGSQHLEEVLAWVALAWPHATSDVLAEAKGEPRWSLDPALAALAEDGLVRRLPDGSFQPLSIPRSLTTWPDEKRKEVHRALAAALLPGTPQRLRHLAASGAPEEVVEEALVLAPELLRLGRSGDARVVLDEALSAARRCADRGHVQARVVTEFGRAMLEIGTAAAIDRALYEVSRAGDAARGLEPLERLLRAARAITAGDTNEAAAALASLDELGPLANFDLEMWRHGQRMCAARRLTRAHEEAVLDEVGAWAKRTGHPRAQAVASAWRGLHLSAIGKSAEAAPMHLEAASVSQRVTTRMAGWLNAAIAFHHCGRLDEALPAARSVLDLASKCRHPVFEAQAESLIRAMRYQRGEAKDPDPELVEAAAFTENPTVLGPVLLTEAAVAWRLGDDAAARGFAQRAADLWGRLGDLENLALCRAFALVCGASAAPGEIEKLADVARGSGDARSGVETLGLLARAAPPELRASLRSEAAARSRDLEQKDPDLRMDVLSVREVLEGPALR